MTEPGYTDHSSLKISVRHAPKTEAPGRPVRVDYGDLAHEYITLVDAIDVNHRSLLTDRCIEATGYRPIWQNVREAYSHLSQILLGLQRPDDFSVVPDQGGGFTVIAGCKVSDSDDGEEIPKGDPDRHPIAADPITDEDFDLFPDSMAVTLQAVGDVEEGDLVVVPDPYGEGFVTVARISEDVEPDPVHAPSHYTDGGIETIDYLRAKMTREAFVGFCQGNALKYLSRAGKKGSAAEDFAKAEVYCKWAKEAAGE